MNQHRIALLLLTVGIFIPPFVNSTDRVLAPRKPRSAVTHSETIPPIDAELEYRDYMVKVARQLGVTCNYCHDVKNLKLGDKATYKVAKEHIRIVDLLNTEGFKGRGAPTADCFMCHRGQAKPEYKEKLR